MDTKKLRVGIIGAGGIAVNAHLPNYEKCLEKIQLTAIADVAKEKAIAAAEMFHIDSAYDNYEEMLKNEELDAVSICTPNKFHAPAAIAALEAGCHVLCEKPPAITVDEAEAMTAAAEKAGRILTYGFHFRHTQQVAALKRYIDADELGDIYAAQVTAVRRRGIPGWGVFTNKELQGGGPLIDIGVHMLDSALYLMGYPKPETVLAASYQKLGNKKGVGVMGDWDWENFSIEDMARGMILFENGASLTIETAFAANVEKLDVMDVSLMGEKGGADLFPLQIYQEKHGTLVNTTPAYLPKTNEHELEITRFVDACLTGSIPLSTPEQGLYLQQIIHAIYTSAERGEAVKISEL
ncbi:Gfo/Idh/MocA family protein [Alteribacillus sp. HJP-4]|uniref:Gfo/Idh/MocA family protein n=1 Tax=Alteribacillus sp. HJP-4 TaxID=2775394 RepID=UPI0035CD361D